jgi:hypothetical protein
MHLKSYRWANQLFPVDYGFLFRKGSFWIGAHWASYNKRLCVNILPMVTIWFIWQGGVAPRAK